MATTVKALSRRHLRFLLLVLTVASCLLVLHQVARSYYDQHYRLPTFGQLQADYESTFLPFGHDVAADKVFDCRTNVLFNLFLAINPALADCAMVKKIYVSSHLSDLPPDTRNSKMLVRDYYDLDFTIKDIQDHRNNRILFLNMLLVNELDRILKRNYSQRKNLIDDDIDRRRRLGQQTNLKLSEFAQIDQIRLGDQLCHPSYGDELDVVVMVITKPTDFQLRSTIRATWGGQFRAANTTRLYFCFGRTPHTDTNRTYSRELVDSLVERENDQFNDIIYFDFDDGYTRLTIKSLAMLRWLALYCPRARHIFKVDTDTLLNFHNLISFIQRDDQTRQSSSSSAAAAASAYRIHGYIWKQAKVVRSRASKFFTSFHDFADSVYPDYAGSSWLLSGEALPLLLLEVAIKHAMPALLWEDLYVSGVCLQRLLTFGLPVRRQQMPGYQNVASSQIDACQFNRTIALAQIAAPISPQLWHQISRLSSSSSSSSSPTDSHVVCNFKF